LAADRRAKDGARSRISLQSLPLDPEWAKVLKSLAVIE
jgi:hypothetical protein